MHLLALQGKEKAWGLEHTSTLLALHNLGDLYSIQGKWKEAEEIYLRALRVEKVWGIDHGTVLKIVIISAAFIIARASWGRRRRHVYERSKDSRSKLGKTIRARNKFPAI